MTDRLIRIRKALRTLDRLLGGEQPPSKIQQFAARHPIVVGFIAALSAFLFGILISDGVSSTTMLSSSLLFGVVMGICFTVTSWGERKRQARLRRAE